MSGHAGLLLLAVASVTLAAIMLAPFGMWAQISGGIVAVFLSARVAN